MGAIAPTAPNLTITLSKTSLGIPEYQQHLPQKPHKYGFRSSAVERYQVSSHNVKNSSFSTNLEFYTHSPNWKLVCCNLKLIQKKKYQIFKHNSNQNQPLVPFIYQLRKQTGWVDQRQLLRKQTIG